MGSLKKILVLALVAAFVFQCSTLEVSAATAQTDSFVFENVIHFNITSDPMEGSDFVETFPQKMYLKNKEIDNPLRRSPNALPTLYADIPNHFQQYYSDILYGNGTVESCGSSITALSMVASYVTGYTYFPDELANWFAAKAENDASRISYAATALQLSYVGSNNWQTVIMRLQKGCPILVQLNGPSMFSDGTHFLVLKGLTEDGKILLNDPNEDNLDKEELAEKYEEGFDELDLSNKFLYAWIFDKSEEPVYVARYMPKAANTGAGRYASLQLTPAEKQLLARIVCVNAYGECEEGQQMMVEVILNRLLSDGYPNELKEMIRGENALCDITHLNEAEPILAHYQAVEKALYGPYLLETNVTDFSFTCHK